MKRIIIGLLLLLLVVNVYGGLNTITQNPWTTNSAAVLPSPSTVSTTNQSSTIWVGTANITNLYVPGSVTAGSLTVTNGGVITGNGNGLTNLPSYLSPDSNGSNLDLTTTPLLQNLNNGVVNSNGFATNLTAYGTFTGNGGGLTNVNYSQLRQILYNPGTITINTNVFGAGATAHYSGPVTNQYRFEITVTTGTVTSLTQNGMITNTYAAPLFEMPYLMTASGNGISFQSSTYSNGPLSPLTNAVDYCVYGIKNGTSALTANTIYIWDFAAIP